MLGLAKSKWKVSPLKRNKVPSGPFSTINALLAHESICESGIESNGPITDTQRVFDPRENYFIDPKKSLAYFLDLFIFELTYLTQKLFLVTCMALPLVLGLNNVKSRVKC